MHFENLGFTHNFRDDFSPVFESCYSTVDVIPQLGLHPRVLIQQLKEAVVETSTRW